MPLTDFVIPYDVLKDIPDLEIRLVSAKEEQVTAAGEEIKIQEIDHISKVESSDVLWICGSHSAQALIKEKDQYESALRRLVDSSSTIVSISEGVLLLADLGYLNNVQVACPQKYHRMVKRGGAIVKKDLTVLDGKFITVESHGHIFDLTFTISKLLLGDNQEEDLRTDWCFQPKYLYNTSELPRYGLKGTSLQRTLFNTLQHNANKIMRIPQVGQPQYEAGIIKGIYDITFYLFDQMRAIDFAITYEVLRHFPNVRIRCVSDRRGPVEVEGKGFSIVTHFAIQDVTKTHLIVIGGGEEGVISELNHSYLVYWLERICEGAQRVLTIADGIRYLGVSGILTRYENYIDWDQPIETGKYMIAQTLTEAIDALLILAKLNHGDKHAKAIQRYVAYGYFQED